MVIDLGFTLPGPCHPNCYRYPGCLCVTPQGGASPGAEPSMTRAGEISPNRIAPLSAQNQMIFEAYNACSCLCGRSGCLDLHHRIDHAPEFHYARCYRNVDQVHR